MKKVKRKIWNAYWREAVQNDRTATAGIPHLAALPALPVHTAGGNLTATGCPWPCPLWPLGTTGIPANHRRQCCPLRVHRTVHWCSGAEIPHQRNCIWPLGSGADGTEPWGAGIYCDSIRTGVSGYVATQQRVLQAVAGRKHPARRQPDSSMDGWKRRHPKRPCPEYQARQGKINGKNWWYRCHDYGTRPCHSPLGRADLRLWWTRTACAISTNTRTKLCVV